MVYWDIASAERFARSAFGDLQNPKDGELLVRHTERVVAYLEPYDFAEGVYATAWLHDVVEDTFLTLTDVEVHFGTAVAEAVDAITHRPGEPREQYWSRVAENEWALKVKLLGDVVDNTDPVRRSKLDEATRARLDAKYLALYRALVPMTLGLDEDVW